MNRVIYKNRLRQHIDTFLDQPRPEQWVSSMEARHLMGNIPESRYLCSIGFAMLFHERARLKQLPRKRAAGSRLTLVQLGGQPT